MLELLGKQIRCKYIFAQKTFYEHGNKANKLLARALESKKATTTIHFPIDAAGCKVNSSPNIAKHFVTYYSKLYNLPMPNPT